MKTKIVISKMTPSQKRDFIANSAYFLIYERDYLGQSFSDFLYDDQIRQLDNLDRRLYFKLAHYKAQVVDPLVQMPDCYLKEQFSVVVLLSILECVLGNPPGKPGKPSNWRGRLEEFLTAQDISLPISVLDIEFNRIQRDKYFTTMETIEYLTNARNSFLHRIEPFSFALANSSNENLKDIPVATLYDDKIIQVGFKPSDILKNVFANVAAYLSTPIAQRNPIQDFSDLIENICKFKDGKPDFEREKANALRSIQFDV